MNRSSLPMLAGVIAALGMTGAATALAQENLERGQTVLERPRPEVEALGLRAGGFLVFPTVEFGTSYEDNVFATEDDKESDFLFELSPSVDVRSDFGRHALTFNAGADVGRYFDFSTENYTDYRVATTGRLDITSNSSLSGELRYRNEHEASGDPDTPAGRDEPVDYSITRGALAYNQRFNRVTARVGGGASYVNYQDVELRSGRVDDQDDRDRREYDTNLRLGYQIQPGYEAFVRGTYRWVRRGIDDEGLDRNSTGYEAVAGAALDLTSLITGEVFAGYLTRDYDDPRLDDFAGIAFGGGLNWSLTQLTDIRASVTRDVRESTVRDVAGNRASSVDRIILAVGVDHELLRNLLLFGRAQYRTDSFNGIAREDDYYTFGGGATYYINRYLYLSAGYTYEQRSSNRPNNDYTDNIIALRLGTQL